MASAVRKSASSQGRMREKEDVRYIHQLPYRYHQMLADILDTDGKWEQLGGECMKLSVPMLERFRLEYNYPRGSPTRRLLSEWGSRNHTITDLFKALYKIKHRQAMIVVKEFVNPRYYYLLDATQITVSDTYWSDNSMENTQSEVFESRQLDSGPIHSESAFRPKVPVEATAYGEQLISNSSLKPRSTHSNQSHRESRSNPDRSIHYPVGSENQSRREPPRKNSPKMRDDATEYDVINDSTILCIPYEKLEEATNNFDPKRILGQGGFGIVYDGIWRSTRVAIKQIGKRSDAPNSAIQDAKLKQSYKELWALHRCRHDNILPMYGYSVRNGLLCLVYQFMENGSLEARLLKRGGAEPLSWKQRLIIARGTACGLQFLHAFERPLIHGDIKSANILLDKNLEAKIGDFGLAQEASKHTMTVTTVRGTQPYLPDEYIRSHQLSPKVDTFSYGVVLFEMATGLRAYDDKRPPERKRLIEHVARTDELKHETLRDQDAGDDRWAFIFHDFIEIGVKCTDKDRRKRPEMVNVLDILDEKLRNGLRNLSLESNIPSYRSNPSAAERSNIPGPTPTTASVCDSHNSPPPAYDDVVTKDSQSLQRSSNSNEPVENLSQVIRRLNVSNSHDYVYGGSQSLSIDRYNPSLQGAVVPSVQRSSTPVESDTVGSITAETGSYGFQQSLPQLSVFMDTSRQQPVQEDIKSKCESSTCSCSGIHSSSGSES